MMLHDMLAVFVAALCFWAILSPRVPTGIVPTIGLGVMFVASVWSLDNWAPADAVADLLMVGTAVVGVGGVWRVYHARAPMMRRRTDWGELSELDEREQRQVAGGRGQPR